ncbi:HlyD family secretion protein [Variovorax sp. VNK109]|uniref:HlyD family efflux transporter periplasmic adaptor subunit n=1 Tax=Variovorax sp. VNK109 TaxID=3400919 RepID=UPI003C04A078
MSGQQASVQVDDRAIWRFIWLGLFIVVAGVGGFIAWASLAPLDRGVPVSGYLVAEGNRKAVQHLTGGMVDQVLVRDGDVVKEGQVVVKMNPVAVQANLNAAREMTGGLQAQVRGLRASIQSRQSQMKLLVSQADNLDQLAKEGYVPRNRVIELQRQVAQLEGETAADQGTLGRAERQIGEVRERTIQYEFDLKNLNVRAPVAGVVQGLTVFTQGAIVQPGHKFFDIVPEAAPLVVEGQVPVNVIDRVQAGLPVELMFTAFNRTSTPVVPGQVTVVSADRVVDERSGIPYYRMTAIVDRQGASMLQGVELKAGMPVDIFVKTGERTLMSYLFKPLADRVHGGLREE